MSWSHKNVSSISTTESSFSESVSIAICCSSFCDMRKRTTLNAYIEQRNADIWEEHTTCIIADESAFAATIRRCSRRWIIGLVNHSREFRTINNQDLVQGDGDASNAALIGGIENHAWTNNLTTEIRHGHARARIEWLQIEGALEEIFNHFLGRPFSFTTGPQVYIIEAIKGYLGFS